MAEPTSTTRPQWGLWFCAWCLLNLANGRWHFAPAAWVAPALLLLYVHTQPVRRGLALAFLAQLLAFFVNWRGMIPVPGVWYFLVAGIYAAVYFLPYVAHRLIAPLLPGLRSTLVFPVSWVALEFLFQRFVTPYGSWASMGYTQTSFLPLLQVSAVTGLPGVHFVMTWTAAIAVWAWEHRSRPRQVRPGLATFGTVLTVILLWGGWRVVSAGNRADLLHISTLTPSAALTAELEGAMRLARNAPNADPDTAEPLVDAASRLNEDLLVRTRAEAEAGADLVVWSEHAARVLRRTEPQLIERAQEIAHAFGVHLILGYGVWDPESNPPFENKLVSIDTRGTASDPYFKARPIVGQESKMIGRSRDRIAIVDTQRGPFAAVICHDLDFPDLIRQAGREQVVLLIGPSSDWWAITPLHARMAIPRAVENGNTLLRPAANGLSLVVDPVGRIVASQLDLGRDGNVMRARVRLVRLRSLYPTLKDTFVYINLVAFLALVGEAVRRQAKRSH